jgi:hypothetical protein
LFLNYEHKNTTEFCFFCFFSINIINLGPRTKWSNNVDYIFVRNYGGVIERLKDELIVSNRHTAYCCQCAWQNIEGKKMLSAFGIPSLPEGGSGAPGENIFWIKKSI